MNYGTDSKLLSIATPDGQVITYAHDPHGRLTSVTYPTGTRTYQYANSAFPNALTGILDENSNGDPNAVPYATWSYDTNGWADGSASAGGVNQVSIVHHGYVSVDVKDALGVQRSYSFQNPRGTPQVLAVSGPVCGDCGAGKLNSYDNNTGYLLQSIDWNNNITGYTFDGTGLLNKRVDAEGTPVQRSTDIQWDAALRNPLESTVKDVGNNLVTKADWQYSASGELLARCQADPTVEGATDYVCSNTGTPPAGVRRWIYTYCNVVDGTQCPLVGLLLTVADPLNNVTSYGYYMADGGSTCATDQATCTYRHGDLHTITNAKAQVTTITSYDGAGRPLSMTDANNVETDLTYYPRGWLRSVTVRGATTADDHVTNYAYDNVGQVQRITQPDGSYLKFGYDAAHRLTDISDNDNYNDNIHYTLDAAGNRTAETTSDSSGTMTRNIKRAFNQIGELQNIRNADNTLKATFTQDANGNPDLLTDGRGFVTDSDVALNRLSHVVQDKSANPADPAHVNANTNYTYDALDRLTQVTDPQGLPTTYVYDGLNDLKTLTSPDTGTTSYTVDAAGNRHTQTDARGVTATYSYDALNRVTGITYPTATLNVSYFYDTVESNCPAADTFAKGRLTRFTDNSGWTQLCYDRFGNLDTKIASIAGGGLTTSYGYDKAGRVIRINQPKGTVVDYTRDAVGRITAIGYRLLNQSTDTPVVKNVTYYPFGPVASITYGDDRVLNRSYDKNYIVTGVSDSATGGLDLKYVRDNVGNLVRITNSAGASGNDLVYDGLNRLTGVNDHATLAPVWTYTYDGTGNRLSKQHLGDDPVPYTYKPDTHQLYAIGNDADHIRSYDADGNTQATGAASPLGFLYDDTGRMSQVNNGPAQAKLYLYNALGQRATKKHTGVSSETQKTVYDEAGHLLGDFDGSSNIVDQYIWLDDLPVGVLSGTTPTLSYIEPDHLGTPRAAISAATNASVWSWPLANDPFGETQPTGALTLNLRMPGQTFDAESGLNYNYFRDYDSGTGRAIESDPLGLRGGISTYAYVGGNPLNFADPLGLAPWNSWMFFPGESRINQTLSGDSAPESDQAVMDWLCKAAKSGMPDAFLMNARRNHVALGDPNLPAAERYIEGYNGDYGSFLMGANFFGKWGRLYPPAYIAGHVFGIGLFRNGASPVDAKFIDSWGEQGVLDRGKPVRSGCGCHGG